MKTFKIAVVTTFCFIFWSCEKAELKKNASVSELKINADTLYFHKDKGFVVFDWNEAALEKYKKIVNNEANFFTIMDDINYYTAKTIACLQRQNIEKITVDKEKYKILAFGQYFVKTDTVKFFDIILFEKGKTPAVKQPVDIQVNCTEYYSTKTVQEDKKVQALENFTPKNYRILSKAVYDWDGDNIKDAIVVYDSIPSGNWEGKGKRPLIAFKGINGEKFSFWFRNDNAVPCRNCAGSADPTFEMVTHAGKLKYNDISLISSTAKNVEYIFDEDLNLTTVNISIEDGISQQNKKLQISRNQTEGISLKNINIEQFEKQFVNDFLQE